MPREHADLPVCTGDDQHFRLTLERRAVLASRPGKDHATDPATLHGRWADQAERAGFHPDRTLAVIDQPAPIERLRDEQIITDAIVLAEDESSTWLQADLARHIATLITPTDHDAETTVASTR